MASVLFVLVGITLSVGAGRYFQLTLSAFRDGPGRRLRILAPLMVPTTVLGDAARLVLFPERSGTGIVAGVALILSVLAVSQTVLTDWAEAALDATMIAGCTILLAYGALLVLSPSPVTPSARVAADLVASLAALWALVMMWVTSEALRELVSSWRKVTLLSSAGSHALGWVLITVDTCTSTPIPTWAPGVALGGGYVLGGVFTALAVRSRVPLRVGATRPRSTFLPYVLSLVTLIACVPGLALEPAFNRPMIYVIGCVCLAALITRQMLTLRGLTRVTDEVRLRESYYRSLLADSTDAILICSSDGRLSYVSPAADHVIGPGAALEGGPVWEAIAVSESIFRSALDRLRSEGGTVLIEGRQSHVSLEAALSLREDGVLASVRDVTERERLRQRLHFLAYHDPLTGLVNRGRVLSRIAAMIGGGERCAVLFVDIDRFKQVNDTGGHSVGDKVLEQVAERLRRQIRDGELIGRLGGDEFVAVLAAGQGDAERLADRLARELSVPFDIEGRHYQLGASIGIALAAPTMLPEEVIRRADLAMYEAKRRRVSWVVFEPGLARAALARATTDVVVSRALRDRSLELHLQPLVSLATGQVRTAESLLRWVDQNGTVMPPAQMLDYARRSGQLPELTDWVLTQAITVLASSPPTVAIAVNVPPEVLVGPGFPGRLEHLLAAHRVPASRLELEVTEDQLLDQAASSDSALHALRAMGMPVMIDDFGTGFSSLGYLVDLPIDGLKIDQRFTRVLPHSEAARSIVGGLVGIARRLELRVVAEGIETEEQHAWARELGVHLGQGWYYARPEAAHTLRDVSDLASWATSRDRTVPTAIG